jgi:hypothetical protein
MRRLPLLEWALVLLIPAALIYVIAAGPSAPPIVLVLIAVAAGVVLWVMRGGRLRRRNDPLSSPAIRAQFDERMRDAARATELATLPGEAPPNPLVVGRRWGHFRDTYLGPLQSYRRDWIPAGPYPRAVDTLEAQRERDLLFAIAGLAPQGPPVSGFEAELQAAARAARHTLKGTLAAADPADIESLVLIRKMIGDMEDPR